jgi:hypothetical protein
MHRGAALFDAELAIDAIAVFFSHSADDTACVYKAHQQIVGLVIQRLVQVEANLEFGGVASFAARRRNGWKGKREAG